MEDGCDWEGMGIGKAKKGSIVKYVMPCVMINTKDPAVSTLHSTKKKTICILICETAKAIVIRVLRTIML